MNSLKTAYICDAIRTPIGRLGGSLASVRTDDLAAIPLKALVQRNSNVDWAALDDVLLGCANQAGEDNRNVARMATLLAGLPVAVSATTVNRLCGSGMEAIAQAARAISAGEGQFYIAGGVESMSRAPFVIKKSEKPFDRDVKLYDTALGWRFVNPKMEQSYGTDALGITAENVAEQFNISRRDQDQMAMRSQQRAAKAQAAGRFEREIVPVRVPGPRGGEETEVVKDEHPREVTFDRLSKLEPAFKQNGTVTAGNSSGLNDGAAALIVASEDAVRRHGLTPRARILGTATAGVPPRIMGIGPVPASLKLSSRLGLEIKKFDLVEINEAFAAQGIAVLRELGIDEDADYVNPNGGAIALGHPLGMSGARLIQTATEQLAIMNASLALCTMCIGVGQGIACAIARL